VAVSGPNFDAIAAEHYGNLPHPASRTGITVREWPIAVQLASATRFGGHATPAEADHFWPEFQALGISPQDYLHTLDRLARWSFLYHGRPPSMTEIRDLHPLKAHEQQRHYADQPDQHYPDLTAGEMVKALSVADHYATKHLQRGAVKKEARFLHHSGGGAGLADQYYAGLAEDRKQKAKPEQQEPF
jgi:hypothetical protein